MEYPEKFKGIAIERIRRGKLEAYPKETGLLEIFRVQKPVQKFTMMPLISMGVGLGLDLNEREKVLSLAGLAFKPRDRTDQAYKYLFIGLYGKSIDECNEFSRKVGVPELGSQQRK